MFRTFHCYGTWKETDTWRFHKHCSKRLQIRSPCQLTEFACFFCNLWPILPKWEQIFCWTCTTWKWMIKLQFIITKWVSITVRRISQKQFGGFSKLDHNFDSWELLSKKRMVQRSLNLPARKLSRRSKMLRSLLRIPFYETFSAICKTCDRKNAIKQMNTSEKKLLSSSSSCDDNLKVYSVGWKQANKLWRKTKERRKHDKFFWAFTSDDVWT